MTGYVLSPAAQADIEQIWDYTVRRWGEAQAGKYVLAIRDACAGLAGGQYPSRAAEDIRAGYRQASVGSHILFFRRPAGGGVAVVRVLHQRMDLLRHV